MNTLSIRHIKLEKHLLKTCFVLAIFYAVGVIGLSISSTAAYFNNLTSFTLLGSSIALMAFQSSPYTRRILLLFIAIFSVGFIVEWVGVKYHALFGSYHYGESLGVKIDGVPILIGLNWWVLSYCCYIISQRANLSMGYSAILGASIMVFYDIFLEQSAQPMGMWYWKEMTIPLSNYITWFGVAFLIQLLLIKSRVIIRNPLAIPLFIIQLSFFIALTIIHVYR